MFVKITLSYDTPALQMGCVCITLQMEVLPAIDNANAISDELEQNTRFEVMLVDPQILGKSSEKTEVSILISDLENSLYV